MAGRIIAIVGGPGSGKDLLVRALTDLWSRHAIVVPKHTSRKRRPDDGSEMICPDDAGFDLGACDVIYESFGERYGLKTGDIWKGLLTGVFQVVVVSDVNAINRLREVFAKLVVLIYVHSEVAESEYVSRERLQDHDEYVARRARGFWTAYDTFLRNFGAFDHVLIHAAEPEDLYDQMFRLMRAYETGAIRAR